MSNRTHAIDIVQDGKVIRTLVDSQENIVRMLSLKQNQKKMGKMREATDEDLALIGQAPKKVTRKPRAKKQDNEKAEETE